MIVNQETNHSSQLNSSFTKVICLGGTLKLFEEVKSKHISRIYTAGLVNNKVHICSECNGSVFFTRTKHGGDLRGVELQSKHMVLQLLNFLRKGKKYRLGETQLKKSLEKRQLVKSYNELESLKLLCKLYNARKNGLLWNIRPLDEAVNVFQGEDGVSQHCGRSGKIIDYQATRWTKSLGHALPDGKMNQSLKRIWGPSVEKFLDNEDSHIISIVLNKTVEKNSIDRRRGRIFMETNIILKQASRNKEDLKHLKTKSITLLISEGETRLAETTINIREESVGAKEIE
ncbi:hypothetical protein CWI38_0267p0040 [Hamiltosporidium tvaerminnensis]|uniref:Uncharacterized protein n=1 Tax=Hamiltosporidium tvaerminnensis TaxID=1176355 RepID=A0A4V2JY22_9MICR|nr:hypothetical protein CWI38_0267p0040 [Hamiltosporidium tvaerminnensis]